MLTGLNDTVATNPNIVPADNTRPDTDINQSDHRMPNAIHDKEAMTNMIDAGRDTFSELLFCVMSAAWRKTPTHTAIATNTMYRSNQRAKMRCVGCNAMSCRRSECFSCGINPGIGIYCKLQHEGFGILRMPAREGRIMKMPAHQGRILRMPAR